jgi:WD40 repeat protein
LVATASRDGTARIWDAQTGNPTTAPLQHGYWVISAEFSRDGKRLVTTSFDKTAQVWDVASGQALTDPLEHEDRVTAAEFSPDGNRVVTASYDNTARIWDLNLASTKCPGWLLPLAEALSGDKLNQRGVLETTSLDRSLTISRTRELLEKLPDSDPGVKWGRWFLSKRGTNAIPAYESSPRPKN